MSRWPEPHDALLDLPQAQFGEYLRTVYARMARFVGADARVAEIGVRPEDRGVISREIIPHAVFLAVDRDPVRARACGGMAADVLETPVRADVILSTAVLHHTAEENIPRLLRNLRAPLLMFSGPSADTHAPYGDHLWHLEPDKLRAWLRTLGYDVHAERIGMTEPFCEVLVVATRTA